MVHTQTVPCTVGTETVLSWSRQLAQMALTHSQHSVPLNEASYLCLLLICNSKIMPPMSLTVPPLSTTPKGERVRKEREVGERKREEGLGKVEEKGKGGEGREEQGRGSG